MYHLNEKYINVEFFSSNTLEECGFKQSAAEVVDLIEVRMALKVNNVLRRLRSLRI